MSPRRKAVVVKGAFGDWAPITVHLDGKISVRERANPYKGAMFAAYPGDIVFSKIDARSGAIGVLQADIPKAVVTSEFPVFVPDPKKLDGRFVQLVLRTGGFLKALRAKATGTSGRKRITPEAFLDLRIPLPSVIEQQTIVAAYDAAFADAAAKDAHAATIEAKAAAEFETALGFGPPVPLPDRPVFVASFKDLDRWSHESVLRRVTGGATATTTWPVVRLGEVVDDIAVGWSPKCLERPAKAGEWGVLKLSAITSGRFRPDQNKALPSKISPRPELEVKAGDVLITRGSGVTRLVGSTALVNAEPPARLMICDLIFRVAFSAKSQVLPAYIAEVLRTTDLRRQIEERRTGAAPMMQKITKSGLNGLTFPLPPLDEQRALIAALEAGRAKAAALRLGAAALRASAWTDFEGAVYASASEGAEPLVEIEAA
jgi:type I restriction enzyme S subunit